jgi:hypothetical protein
MKRKTMQAACFVLITAVVVMSGCKNEPDVDPTPPVLYSVTPVTDGAGTISPQGGTSFAAGATVSVIVSASIGFTLDTNSLKVEKAGGGAVPINRSTNSTLPLWTFTMPARNVNVSCTFTAVGNPAITYNYTSDQGSVSGPESAAPNTTINFTVTPNNGYSISVTPTLSTGGTVSGSGNNWSFTMPSTDVTVSVIFTGSGSGNGNPAITYNYNNNQGIVTGVESAAPGTTVNFTATPGNGYSISGTPVLSNGGTVSGSGNIWSFTMPNSNVTVSVTFTSSGAPVEKMVLLNGVWGAANSGGVALYPSNPLEVWDGGGVDYDEVITGGYNGGTKATRFNTSRAPNQWTAAVIFFAPGSGVTGRAYDLKFHVKGWGGFDNIAMNLGTTGSPWNGNDIIDVITGSMHNGLRGFNYTDWTEITVTWNGTAEVGAMYFLISVGGGGASDFYMDNIRFVPKGSN